MAKKSSLVKYVKVKNDAFAYSSHFKYWFRRAITSAQKTPVKSDLLKRQNRRCSIC